MINRFLYTLTVIALAVLPAFANPAGDKLTQTLDSMDVMHHWLSGHDRVDWKSGDPIGPAASSRRHTHCSQFTAAVAERLGIYILRPPDHSSVLLANAQEEWLKSDAGRKAGWSPVRDGWKGHELANQGYLVVAVYRSRHASKPGHIAVLRPSHWSHSHVERDGPEIIQAGGTNYASTSLERGFSGHRGAFRHHRIELFSHPVSP